MFRTISAKIFLMMLAVAPAHSGEVASLTYRAIFPSRTNVVELLFAGQIEQGDAAKIERAVSRANDSGTPVVRLNLVSPGGNLSEGIKIGRLARKYRLETVSPNSSQGYPSLCHAMRYTYSRLYFEDPIAEHFSGQLAAEPDCVCVSACAYAWLGGVLRSGVVGFHHASVSDGNSSISLEELEETLSASDQELRDYFTELRVPPSLLHVAFENSSASMGWIDVKEHSNLTVDRIFKEYLITRCGPEHHDITEAKELQIQKKMLSKIEAGEDFWQEQLDYYNNAANRALYLDCIEQAQIAAAAEEQKKVVVLPQKEERD